MPGGAGGPVVNFLVCFLHFAREAAGALACPAFPTPSLGGRDFTTRARLCRENAEVCIVTPLRGARDKIAEQFCAGATKQSSLFRWIASLAMTAELIAEDRRTIQMLADREPFGGGFSGWSP
jgi:hypothetical protein